MCQRILQLHHKNKIRIRKKANFHIKSLEFLLEKSVKWLVDYQNSCRLVLSVDWSINRLTTAARQPIKPTNQQQNTTCCDCVKFMKRLMHNLKFIITICAASSNRKSCHNEQTSNHQTNSHCRDRVKAIWVLPVEEVTGWLRLHMVQMWLNSQPGQDHDESVLGRDIKSPGFKNKSSHNTSP